MDIRLGHMCVLLCVCVFAFFSTQLSIILWFSNKFTSCRDKFVVCVYVSFLFWQTYRTIVAVPANRIGQLVQTLSLKFIENLVFRTKSSPANNQFKWIIAGIVGKFTLKTAITFGCLWHCHHFPLHMCVIVKITICGLNSSCSIAWAKRIHNLSDGGDDLCTARLIVWVTEFRPQNLYRTVPRLIWKLSMFGAYPSDVGAQSTRNCA